MQPLHGTTGTNLGAKMEGWVKERRKKQEKQGVGAHESEYGRMVWVSLAVTEGGVPDVHGKGHTHKAVAAGPDEGPSDQMGNIPGCSLFF